MRVAKGGVGDEKALLRAAPFGEFGRAEAIQKLTCSFRWGVEGGVRNGSVAQDGGFGTAGDFGIAVDGDFGQIVEEFGGAVAAGDEGEERWSLVEERRCGVAALKGGMLDHVFEERDVCLYATDAELAKGAVHALASLGKVAAPGGDFHEQRIVERRDDGATVSGGGVETDAEAGGRTVGVDLAVVGHEAVGGIFGGDAALERGAVKLDGVLLGNADFGAVQIEALGDLDLGADDVDAGDDFGDGVFDLDTRVDFDEEPFVGVGVDKEFDGARVVVVGGAGKFNSGGAEFSADFFRKADGGGDLDNLLMAALDGAIALI